jgi:hypothetical protein
MMPDEATQLAATYHAVAHDVITGDLGVPVQSHHFAVAALRSFSGPRVCGLTPETAPSLRSPLLQTHRLSIPLATLLIRRPSPPVTPR